jgi:uncharacterized protein YecE (DUF72 family)
LARARVHGGLSERARVHAEVLAEYARYPLFRTVGIDRSYYAPIPPAELEEYAAQMPEGFVPIAKVWSDVTTAVFPKHPRSGARGGERNPRFLDYALFDEAMGSPFLRTMGDRDVPMVLEIPPSPGLDSRTFAQALARFLAAAQGKHRFAVELRNRELLTPRYFRVLREYGATHVLNYWERMPDLDVQLAAASPLHGGFTVVRLLIPPGQKYEVLREAYAPFDRIVVEQPLMRRHVIRIIQVSLDLGNQIFVIVNNKAEGSSPLTVEGLIRLLLSS